MIEDIEPGIEGGIGFKMPEMGREFKATGLEFGAEKIKDSIAPHGLDGVMMEIGLANPALIIR